mmetsp:Transcript_16691/g.36646  ORF Transcript_16691/g.36646 Transcript_16691/m.36646 type:complete len:766 (+) Transcript_16691:110-2407(+)
MSRILGLSSEAPSKQMSKKEVGIGKACWKLEDAFRGERSVAEYPDEAAARELYIEVATAENAFRKALFCMVGLSIFETPSWCNNTDDFMAMVDSHLRCEVEGAPDLLLSNIAYLPPGWGLVIEAGLILIILRKLILDRRLEKTYFNKRLVPSKHEEGKMEQNTYLNIDIINFGLLMVFLELADMLVYFLFQPKYRFAFIPRTGYLCLLPAMHSLFVCLKHVIVEFLSIASFLAGTMVFFAWICATIFDDMTELGTIFRVPVNKGFESFSASLYSMFVAGATEEFLEVFIRSYTAYRGFGLLWLIYLVIVQMLLLSLVLDTLVAAYTQFREHLEETTVEKNVDGIMQTYDILVQAIGRQDCELDKDSFLQFIREFRRSPRARYISDKTANIMFDAVDKSGDGSVSKLEFSSVCVVMNYNLWTTKKFSWIHNTSLWETAPMQWFVEKVERGSFDTFMNIVLMLNLIMVVIETDYDLNGIEAPPSISNIELCFSMVYVVEVGLRLCVYSWPEYWSYRSNQFDFFTTWALLGSSIIETLESCNDATPGGCSSNIKRYMNILRLLRLLRVIKQLKQLKAVQFMVDTITKLVTASKDVLIPLGVVLFFFTSLSVQLWGGLIHPSHEELKKTEYGKAMFYVLNYNDFLMAFGVWVVALLCEFVPKFAESVHVTSPHPWTWWVHFIFYIIGVSIVFELVKAFTIEVFVELTKRRHEKKEEEDEEESNLKLLSEKFQANGENLHFRNIGDVMMQEKMKEAFDHLKHQMDQEHTD